MSGPSSSLFDFGACTPQDGDATEAGTSVHTIVWGPILDASEAPRNSGVERCFKCPKERRSGDQGWYCVELREPRESLRPSRLYVCPEDYLDFAADEKRRWRLIHDGAGEVPATDGKTESPPAPPEAPACTADELIELLSTRGLAGWVFLVRDVAAGRVRRIHLRQLPADPEIRKALLTYLHSAGTTVTVSRIFQDQERRFHKS